MDRMRAKSASPVWRLRDDQVNVGQATQHVQHFLRCADIGDQHILQALRRHIVRWTQQACDGQRVARRTVAHGERIAFLQAVLRRQLLCHQHHVRLRQERRHA
jgi:hypothetical protein